MINLKKEDLVQLAQDGFLKQEQIEPLWTALEAREEGKSKFDLTHVIYYFGALLIIFGMGWFLNEAWTQAGGLALFILGSVYVGVFTFIALLLKRKNLNIPSGLTATVAVCLVPLTVFGFQKMTGLWPQEVPGNYRDYHVLVKGSWFFLELGTILAGALMLRFIKFPFLTAPIFFSLWYMSMDLTPLLFGKEDFTWDERKWVSVCFGAVILLLSYLIDKRTKLDYAFWGYLFGTVAFWGSLSLMDSQSEVGKFLYFMISFSFILTSVLFERKIFLICGALGCLGYLAHLADKVFSGFFSFPITLTLLGLGILGLGIRYQKNKTEIDARARSLLPEFLLKLSPTRRSP